MVCSVYRVNTLDKGMIHVLRGMERDGTRLHHPATQNGMSFKVYELFISGIRHLIFLDCGCPRVTETESETVDKGDYCINTRQSTLENNGGYQK